jgi:hypothetical protein
VYKSGFDPTVNVRLRHSFNEPSMIGEVDSMLARMRALFCKSGIPDLPNARAGEAGVIARCSQRAFFRTPYGILASIDPLADHGH